MALKTLTPTPLLYVNPKSYLFGKDLLSLAKAADDVAEKTGLALYFTCPFTDIRMVARHTNHIIVTAQSMEPLTPGRGMGHLLPESIEAAGARAVTLNHAENQLTLSTMYANIKRAADLNMASVVCADSAVESKAVAELTPDIILSEPTDLIGTGVAADSSYIEGAVSAIKDVNEDVRVLIGSGITTADDCYNAVIHGADGAASTSGVVKAPDPAKRIAEMADAVLDAWAKRA